MELAERFLKAIELEQNADSQLTDFYLERFPPKKLAKMGFAILNLLVSGMRTGLGGKTLLDLTPDPAFSKEVSAGSLKVGDIVKLERMGAEEKKPLEGVILRIEGKGVTVAVEEAAEDDTLSLYNNTNDSARVWIVQLSNTATYKRMTQAMKKLRELTDSNKSEVIRILLGEAECVSSAIEPLKYLDSSLNESQKKAVAAALSRPVTIIHGPPGTGKTHTLVELIRQLVQKDKKVLVCGPSNISVDNILERLSETFKPKKKKAGDNLIRIGHPARLLQTNLKHLLDVLSKSTLSSDGQILNDIQREIADTLGRIQKTKRYAERRALWQELKQLKKELKVRERKVVLQLLGNAQVVLATLHGAGANEFLSFYKEGKPLFDTLVIDEVSQSLEPQCWIPLLLHSGIKRVVIAGDNKQLPATVKSVWPKDKNVANLEVTLFDRLVRDCKGDTFKELLDTQYRMNTAIMDFPSQALYEGRLKAGHGVAGILLTDLHGVEATDDTCVPTIWYDTQGSGMSEREDDESNGSKYNDFEAQIIGAHVALLLTAGVAAEDIGIITPYSAQVRLLRLLVAGPEISTIDGFQGREKEAIVLLLVRLNDARDIGFLKETRRLNVAMTRPRRQLCVVGDMSMLGTAFLGRWAQHAEQHYELRYPDPSTY